LNEEQKKRKKIYTPEYYLALRKTDKLKWKDVPFVCLCCGDVFHLPKVKPKSLPKYCTPLCRMAMFDGRAAGLKSPNKLKDIDWDSVKSMVVTGKSSTHIAKHHKICVASVHKHVLKLLGTDMYNRLIENGKKARKRGQLNKLQESM